MFNKFNHTSFDIRIYKNGTRLYRCKNCNKFFSNRTKKMIRVPEYEFKIAACPHCRNPMKTWGEDMGGGL